jgi:hypothetical protein
LCGVIAITNSLAAPLLEGGDDLPDRLVLLSGVPLLPPHHEIGGLSGDRRHHERYGENDGPVRVINLLSRW